MTSIGCIFYFIRIALSESKNDIALYQVLGYDTRSVKKIYMIQYFILITLALLISLIISFGVIALANSVMSNDPNFSVLTIRLSLSEILLYYLFLLLITFLVVILLFKKIKENKSLVFLMGD